MNQPEPEPVVYEEVSQVDAATAAKQMTGLRDIAVPDPVSWRPQTAGWYVAFALLIAGAAVVAWRLWRRWRALAYRRAALAELGVLEQQLATSSNPLLTIRALNALVKRVRLSEGARPAVAPLSGAPWLQALDRTWTGGQFASGVGVLLGDVPYEREAAVASVADVHALIAEVRQWIRGHGA